MANPFLSMLGVQPTQAPQNTQTNGMMSNLNTVVGLYNIAKRSGNTMETLNQMAQTNPAIAKTIEYINANGGDMNKIANELAQKQGVSLSLLASFFK